MYLYLYIMYLFIFFFQTFYFIHLFSLFQDEAGSNNLFLSIDSTACYFGIKMAPVILFE